MLDLVVQVARQDGQDFATVEVCGTEHLSQIPFALCFVGELLLGEGFGLVREVSTEDHCIGPQVSRQVGIHVGFSSGGKVGARQRWEKDVVFDDLTLGLVHNIPEARGGLFPGLLACKVAPELNVVESHRPLEQAGQYGVGQGLREEEGAPFAVAGDTEDAVSDVIVHAQDVGVFVVDEVVGVHPLR